MRSVDVLGRRNGDAVGSYVAIIIGHVDGEGLARISLPDELAICDHGTCRPDDARRGITPPAAMAAVSVPTSFPPLPPSHGVSLGGLSKADLCGR